MVKCWLWLIMEVKQWNLNCLSEIGGL